MSSAATLLVTFKHIFNAHSLLLPPASLVFSNALAQEVDGSPVMPSEADGAVTAASIVAHPINSMSSMASFYSASAGAPSSPHPVAVAGSSGGAALTMGGGVTAVTNSTFKPLSGRRGKAADGNESDESFR